MEIILKEKIKNLGGIGDIVKVKAGFARNFLIPTNKALYATENNIKILNEHKDQLQKIDTQKLQDAQSVADSLNNKPFVFIRNTTENGALYGSVTVKDIISSLEKSNHHLSFNQVKIDHQIKTTGVYNVILHLHPEVDANILVVVARTNEEADKSLKKYNQKAIEEESPEKIKEEHSLSEKTPEQSTEKA